MSIVRSWQCSRRRTRRAIPIPCRGPRSPGSHHRQHLVLLDVVRLDAGCPHSPPPVVDGLKIALRPRRKFSGPGSSAIYPSSPPPHLPAAGSRGLRPWATPLLRRTLPHTLFSPPETDRPPPYRLDAPLGGGLCGPQIAPNASRFISGESHVSEAARTRRTARSYILYLPSHRSP